VDVTSDIFQLMKRYPLAIDYHMIPQDLLNEDEPTATQFDDIEIPQEQQVNPSEEQVNLDNNITEGQSDTAEHKKNDTTGKESTSRDGGCKSTIKHLEVKGPIIYFLFLAFWTEPGIFSLISIYGEVDGEREPGQTNKKVWDIISAKLGEEGHLYSAVQCKWKFTYLKQRYMQEKKARGPSNTGGVSSKFKYFYPFDELFHNSHKHGLPCPVSSNKYQQVRRSKPVPVNESAEDSAVLHELDDESYSELDEVLADVSNLDNDSKKPKPRRRQTVADIVKISVEKLGESSKQRHQQKIQIEEKRNDILEKRLEFEKQRHQDNLAVLSRLINVLEGSSKPVVQEDLSDSE
jgi:Myb/SANT-like DNA-binding domain